VQLKISLFFSTAVMSMCVSVCAHKTLGQPTEYKVNRDTVTFDIGR